jgi:hypothetical protein
MQETEVLLSVGAGTSLRYRGHLTALFALGKFSLDEECIHLPLYLHPLSFAVQPELQTKLVFYRISHMTWRVTTCIELYL